jgi:hypothetical protein
MQLTSALTTKVFQATRCVFTGTLNGIGLNVTATGLRLYGCTFSSNAASGLATVYNATNQIERCKFLNNASSGIVDSTWDGTQAAQPYNRNAYLGNSKAFEDSLGNAITPPGSGNVFASTFPPYRNSAGNVTGWRQ